jgi:hypothetical protein
MHRPAAAILSAVLWIATGYALGNGAVLMALPSAAAALLLLPFTLGTPAPHANPGRRVGEVSLGNALQNEIARSRRHNHTFAVVRLPSVASPASDGSRLAARPIDDHLAVLRGEVRIVDHVWSERDGLHILLPESDAEQVRMFMARMQPKLSPEMFRGARTAIYPADGPTEQALLEHLHEHGRQAFRSDERMDPHAPLAS